MIYKSVLHVFITEFWLITVRVEQNVMQSPSSSQHPMMAALFGSVVTAWVTTVKLKGKATFPFFTWLHKNRIQTSGATTFATSWCLGQQAENKNVFLY